MHRPTFVALLITHGLIDKGYVSLIESPMDGHTWKKIWDGILDRHASFRDLFIQYKHDIISSTPLTVDTESLVINPNWHQPELCKIYHDTYFTITSETHFYKTDGRVITEKTFKPIINNHPFILLAPPNSLTMLRERGYKTFHPYINEQYDNEHDDQKRMLMVLEETKRLCSLDEIALKDFVDGCRDICLHNYDNFSNHIKPYVPLN